MRQHFFPVALAILLTITLSVPSTLFLAPQQAHAQLAVIDAGDIVQNTITAIETTIMAALEDIGVDAEVLSSIKNAITAANSVLTEANVYLLVIDRYVIQPLAFILSGNVLKAMTSATVAFVIGQTNGTGAPQFVQNVNGLMRDVGDVQTSVFLLQLSRSPNSPFAASIASSLRTNYLQQTSAAGFFAANKDTLTQSSPNINAFLSGNWSQGGVRAWFALTTQTQNNPYTLYQASQSQLGTLVATAQSASRAQLDWGKGFLSWCGTNSDGGPGGDACASGETGAGCTTASGAEGTCDGSKVCQPTGGTGNVPTNCTKSDGSPGIIKTPGSYISDTLSKVTGAAQDKLVAAGNAGKELNGVLGNVAQALSTVNSAIRLLGGLGNSSGGLAGAGQSSGGNRSVLGDLATPGFAGVTSGGIYQGAATLPGSGFDLLNRVAAYKAAWDIIAEAANTAKAKVTALVNSCPAQASAVADFSTQIESVLARSAAATVAIENATAAVRQLQDDLNSGTVSSTAIDAELQMIQNMPPSSSDVATAEAGAHSSGTINTNTASSTASINRLSLVDQMNLIGVQIQALQSSCPASTAQAP